MDQSREYMKDFLLRKAQGYQGLNDPVATRPPPSHNPSQMPHSDIPFHKLAVQQRQDRTNWIIDEASRIIADKQAGRAPERPFTPQYPTPDAFDAETAHRNQITSIAKQLAESLNARDRMR